MPAKKDSITANWLESRHQWVAKSREYYKGETFDCSGSSKLGKTEARKAWKRNYDKHIAAKNWILKLEKFSLKITYGIGTTPIKGMRLAMVDVHGLLEQCRQTRIQLHRFVWC